MIVLFNEFEGKCPYYLTGLASTVNALPGIEVSHAFHHIGQGPTILFTVKNTNKGLFFLTRCIDRRYFRWGNSWNITLSVGDQYINQKLPIVYDLSTISSEYEKSIGDLIDNINYHFHHENFMNMYELDKNDFKCIDTIIENRDDKINSIL